MNIEHLRRLHEAATPGPWEDCDVAVGVMVDGLMHCPEARMADGVLALAVRNALPELLDEVERLRAIVYPLPVDPADEATIDAYLRLPGVVE